MRMNILSNAFRLSSFVISGLFLMYYSQEEIERPAILLAASLVLIFLNTSYVLAKIVFIYLGLVIFNLLSMNYLSIEIFGKAITFPASLCMLILLCLSFVTNLNGFNNVGRIIQKTFLVLLLMAVILFLNIAVLYFMLDRVYGYGWEKSANAILNLLAAGTIAVFFYKPKEDIRIIKYELLLLGLNYLIITAKGGLGYG